MLSNPATAPVGIAAGFSAVNSTLGTATTILNTVANINAQRKEANTFHAGNANTNLISAVEANNFSARLKLLKEEHARVVDEYFTMFGYQTNRVKVPYVSSRPYFNYVKTIDVNIKGKDNDGIPADQMERLKAVYNNGVTLWKSTATICDYSVDNSP